MGADEEAGIGGAADAAGGGGDEDALGRLRRGGG